MLIQEANEIIDAANQFLTAPKTEVPDGPHGMTKGETGRKISGRCFEVLKPFLMMRIESKITVGGMEINIDNGRMTKILAEYDAKTGKVQQAFVIIPSGLEAGFTQAFYDAVKHVIASYKRIKKNELYR